MELARVGSGRVESGGVVRRRVPAGGRLFRAPGIHAGSRGWKVSARLSHRESLARNAERPKVDHRVRGSPFSDGKKERDEHGLGDAK